MTVDTIIFDFGGVLVDWNPRYLFQKVFEDETKMDYFLTHICTSDWNEEQDAGRSLQEGTDLLVAAHPEWEAEIQLFYDRWSEMLGGAIEGTVEILRRFKNSTQYRLYGLTNWSAETFPIAEQQFDFLNWFDGILVSGQEGIRKPNPKIYQLLLERFDIDPTTSVFIDDNLRNVKAARQAGIPTIHFTSPAALEAALQGMGILN